ncbi:MAG: metallophosphoesterase [Propionicimonas sp.]
MRVPIVVAGRRPDAQPGRLRPRARVVVAAMLAAVLLPLGLGCTSEVLPSPARPAGTPATADPSASFAIIGDYGRANRHEAAVAALVASWNPGYVIAVGDAYYAVVGGTGAEKYDRSTGAFYCRWLKDVNAAGGRCPSGEAAVNAFFPALGNHDYADATPAPTTYLDYFTLPGAGFTSSSGNERYYDFVEGPIHFFVLNSNPEEPDGISATSTQALWLKARLAASTSAWNIVYDHHPPYSSDRSHGVTAALQWPYAAWGADVVVSGHAHIYERILRDGIVYFVNGLGGAPRHTFRAPVAGSVVRYNDDWGAQRVTVTPTSLTFAFHSVAGDVVDSYTVTR